MPRGLGEVVGKMGFQREEFVVKRSQHGWKLSKVLSQFWFLSLKWWKVIFLEKIEDVFVWKRAKVESETDHNWRYR